MMAARKFTFMLASGIAVLWGALFLFTITVHADPLTIRVGWQVPPEKFLPMLANRTDIAPHAGSSYVIELVHFGASSEQITALATNQIDLASFGYSSYALAIENAHLDDVRIVLDGYQDGVKGYFSTQFRVLKSSPINTVDDLKGKVLVANGPGSGGDMAMRQILRTHRLEEKKDYTLIAGPANNQFPMLAERKADLVTISNVQALDPAIQDQSRILFTARDSVGISQWAFYAARSGFLDGNRAKLQDFFDDALRVTRWQLDPAHRADAIAVMAKFSKLPPENYERYIYTHDDLYRDPDGRPNLEALKANLAVMRGLGFLKTVIDVPKHTDLSFIETAARHVPK